MEMKKIFLMMLTTVIFGLGNIAFGQTFVDLGLPSGTKWCNHNEQGRYTFDEAVSRFGSHLPTKAQCDELFDKCKWEKRETGGYKVTGPNGKSIILPAKGYKDCDGSVNYEGFEGTYWTSEPWTSVFGWYFYFKPGEFGMYYSYNCCGRSVRLVQN